MGFHGGGGVLIVCLFLIVRLRFWACLFLNVRLRFCVCLCFEAVCVSDCVFVLGFLSVFFS